jgi:hypothetical protein
MDGGFEQISIEHVARDRLVFADGALVAARWLVGRRGIFTMDDVVRLDDDREQPRDVGDAPVEVIS